MPAEMAAPIRALARLLENFERTSMKRRWSIDRGSPTMAVGWLTFSARPRARPRAWGLESREKLLARTDKSFKNFVAERRIVGIIQGE